MHHYLVPQQQDGPGKNLEYHVVTEDVEDAEDWFVDAKERMLDVNNWKRFMRVLSPDLTLTDKHGRIMNRHAHKGDHIRIDLPGPGTREMNAYDWVVIEAIEYDDYPDDNRETFALKIRTAIDPDDGVNKLVANDTTGTLVIERYGKTLSASYHGRDELVDQEVGGSKGANYVWLGITDEQWSSLLKGLIE